MVEIIAEHGDYRFCKYPSGMYTVDLVTDSVGMTIKKSVHRIAIAAWWSKEFNVSFESLLGIDDEVIYTPSEDD